MANEMNERKLSEQSAGEIKTIPTNYAIYLYDIFKL